MTLPPPPGPEKSLSLSDGLAMQRDTLGFVQAAVAQYGDIVRFPIIFWNVVLLNHPDHIRHILLENQKNYGRGTFQFEKFAMVTGQGLLTTHGELWLKRRRLIQPSFHRKTLAGIAQKMGEVIEGTAERWRAAGPQLIDLDAEMLRLALEIIGTTLFSLDLRREAAELSQEMLEMMEYVVYRSQNLLALPTAVPTPRNLRFRRRLKALDRRIYDLIATRRAAPPADDDLLDLLIHSHYADGTPMRDDEIRDEMMTLIIAGYETVASGMGWIWHLLLEHPAVLKQLEAELGRELNGRSPTFEQISRLTYLQQVISETFRLYPPSWLITREALADDAIGGYAIPAKTIVAISPYAIHRHPQFWPEPERFDPERHAPDAKPTPFAYIPFGGGPHLCIGQHFALLEAQMTLATLAQQFTLRPDPKRPVEMRPRVTLRPQGGLWMHVTPK